MASSSTSSNQKTSLNQKSFKYDVFLSFRGEDTRKTFVGHLYNALKRQGIQSFKDDEKLEKGNRIDELFKAIEESKLFIIVFSKNYAYSSWCLKELAHIMECQDRIQQIAYPIFYDIEPTEVRKQSGGVGGAFDGHNNEDVGKWKEALEQASNLVGWNVRNRVEAEAINEIVEDISLKLRSSCSSIDENLVGMERRMQDLESYLQIDSEDDVRMIGIIGMGGIGKTTLARAIFEKESFHFEGKCFVENVRADSKARGLASLQQQVLSDILKDDSLHVSGVFNGEDIMKKRLPHIKVLLVLDDVDSVDQLEALAGATKWFKEGSRIIITTRDKQVLIARGVNEIHEVGLLTKEDADCLFRKHAFKTHSSIQGYEKLSSKVVDYAAGLPLTIRVLGLSLRGQEISAWKDTLKRLQTIPCKKTLDILEISYIGLEEDQQQIFLDVACYMKGFWKEDAIRILESRGFCAVVGLNVLELKSLVTISNGRLGMHDSIEEMGRNIVQRTTSPRDPSKDSRLWNQDDIEELLTDELGTEATLCIRLDTLNLSPETIMNGLGFLKKLRLLLLLGNEDGPFHSDWKFDPIKQYFPNTLQFLNWDGYPFLSLPQTFRANYLVGLELPCSRITRLWENGDKKLFKVEDLDLGITRILERLDLKECRDLTEIIVPAAGCLESLVYLNLIGCSRFKSISFIKQLESLDLLTLPKLDVNVELLEESPRYSRDNLPKLRLTCLYHDEKQPDKCFSLDLKPCTKFKSFSTSICGLRHLRQVTFNGCISDLPEDLDQFVCIEKLSLLSARIKCLPDSICRLKHLKFLKLEYCTCLERLPEDLGHLERLEKLSLSSTNIRRLPDSICMLKHLKSLKLKSCLLLEKLPKDIGELVCLEKLDLLSSRIRCLPDSFSKLKHLKSLELEYCRSLERLPKDLGQLECLEKLMLTKCYSLRDIPNSICQVKRLRCFHLPFCNQVEKLPEELGSLECLDELNIKCTGISHLPHSISSLKSLRIVSS